MIAKAFPKAMPPFTRRLCSFTQENIELVRKYSGSAISSGLSIRFGGVHDEITLISSSDFPLRSVPGGPGEMILQVTTRRPRAFANTLWSSVQSRLLSHSKVDSLVAPSALMSKMRERK